MDAIEVIELGIPGPSGAGISAAQYAALLVASGTTYSTKAQETSDTASTTSTATYSLAQTRTLSLGTGTWTVSVFAVLMVKHSTGGSVDVQLHVATADGDQYRLAAETSIWTPIFVTQVETGVASGSRDVNLNFKAGTAGTVTARNPAMRIIAFRTA
jgi:hypothetical protein